MIRSLKFNAGIGLLWLLLASLMHEMTESAWSLSWVLGGAFTYIWFLQYKLDTLTSMFKVADAELVRVSALAHSLESDLLDVGQKLDDELAKVRTE